ncbi:unnamed protein product [Ilex paraguariensis]|uniref:RIN4 pathogenic type III effector avirulence factor Avr cleavage site domain-containing protein n=1 Tax=Ilex paraguariensis TaxID=185542 RepID=A0ABC8T2V7_9AQUA
MLRKGNSLAKLIALSLDVIFAKARDDKNSNGTGASGSTAQRMDNLPKQDQNDQQPSTQDKGRPLPKFGEWDVNNPASADGFTVIFAKARDDKNSNGTGVSGSTAQRMDNQPKQDQNDQQPSTGRGSGRRLATIEQDKGRPLPKFGEWDVNNPASADGFTVIFAKARDDKNSNGTGVSGSTAQRMDNQPKQDQNDQQPSTGRGSGRRLATIEVIGWSKCESF